MGRVQTKIDAGSGLLTIQKSGGGDHSFFKGGDLTSGGSAVNLTNPYAHSVWVSAAIKHVANPISAVPITFSQDVRGSEVELVNPVLKEFWENPGVSAWGQPINQSDFKYATAAWHKLSGNAFWIMDDSWLDSKIKIKSKLILARPDRMQPLYGAGGRKLIGWRFTDGDGMSQNLIPEQVVHHRAFNPLDDILGLPEWLAVKIAAESDYSAGQFAKAIMDNNGDRGPFVIAKNGVPSDEQREQIERMLRQKRELSRSGQFRAAFLTGDITVEEPSVQAVDAAFIGQRLENRHEVFIGFGVPASMADVTASYSIGSASDRYRLIEETCMPLGAKICDGVEMVSKRLLGIMPRSGNTLYAALDWDQHSTIQQVRSERTKEARELWNTGVPWTVLNDHLGLKLPRFAGDSVARVPFSMKAVDDGSLKDEGVSAQDDEAKAGVVDELESLFKARNEGHICKHDHEVKENFEQSAEDTALWEMLQAKRKPWEKAFEKKFNRLLFEARAETMRNVRSGYAPEVNEEKGEGVKVKVDKAEARESSLSLTFDLGPWMDKISDGMGKVSEQAVIAAGGELVTDELELEEAVSLPTAAVESVVQNRQNMLSRTSTDIWHEIRELIAEGIEEGDSIDDLANRIKDKFNDISKMRARRIAVTETAVAYEKGRYLTMKEAGITHKKWITASDANVRGSHQAVNGEVLPIEELFVVGDDALLHPADPNGSAEEVINCRCVSVADLGEG